MFTIMEKSIKDLLVKEFIIKDIHIYDTYIWINSYLSDWDWKSDNYIICFDIKKAWEIYDIIKHAENRDILEKKYNYPKVHNLSTNVSLYNRLIYPTAWDVIYFDDKIMIKDIVMDLDLTATEPWKLPRFELIKWCPLEYVNAIKDIPVKQIAITEIFIYDKFAKINTYVDYWKWEPAKICFDVKDVSRVYDFLRHWEDRDRIENLYNHWWFWIKNDFSINQRLMCPIEWDVISFAHEPVIIKDIIIDTNMKMNEDWKTMKVELMNRGY